MCVVLPLGYDSVRIIVDGVDAGFSGTSAWPYVTGGVAYFPTYRYLHVGGIITNPSNTEFRKAMSPSPRCVRSI